MTASVTPEPTATTNGVVPGTGTPAASPPRRRLGPILTVLGSLAAVVVGVIALFGLLGPGVVDSSVVANEIQGRITSGQATCPEDLKAEVGASISCSVLDGADTYSVRATVTAVDGDDVSYRIEQV
ncbi:hypothetical protein GCM10023201_38650 [Actinomycetospora corticicola]|uniref:DUF4333 domain-containing protein n=1 Tax=Actinomycetospora corticicola TaxID=663602 RepID=A0A7Y9J7H2_9PSEU|nr:DUF4333 domain-containing protein [Actinomycetospora corticicola]NYD38031.1 hypothetical protein [Actinomycetospora corticicola]